MSSQREILKKNFLSYEIPSQSQKMLLAKCFQAQYDTTVKVQLNVPSRTPENSIHSSAQYAKIK